VLNRCNQASADRLERWHRAIQLALADGEGSRSSTEKRERLADRGPGNWQARNFPSSSVI
jgi:hypothetical protein